MASSSRFSVDATVRLHGLQARPALNGQTGRIISFDETAGRYAVRLLDDADNKPILVKPANLESVIDGAYDVRGAAALAEQKDSAGRQARLDALVELVKQQHTLKEEASEHTAVVAAAGSRNDLPDGVWDRVVEIMRIVQSTCNSCNAGFPTLLKEAIENNDALLWSRASVEYAYYLLGQSPMAALESPIEEAKRVARRVLRVHANHRCSDAMLAAAVMEADGPFARWSGEFEAAMSQASANERPEIDEDEWHAAKERIAMHESLQAAWDEDTHKRLAEKGASMAEEAERAVEKATAKAPPPPPPPPLAPVPPFLQGCWTRQYIKRRAPDGTLGPPDASPVRYLQTPHAFIDVRSITDDGSLPGAECMAFAGVATAERVDGSSARVHWHACHNYDPRGDEIEERWEEALGGKPRQTEDVGDFVPLEDGLLWRETDPEGTLEEVWEKKSDGDGRYLALRHKAKGLLLVVVGDWFGVVEERPDCGWYCAGDVKEDGKWIVAVSTARELEGSELPEASLPPASEWEALKGRSVEWSTLERQARPVREMVNSTRGGVAIS